MAWEHIDGLATGWFGIPGAKSKWSTKVHVVERSNCGPICGARLSKRQRFQWCSDGIARSYVECPKCKQLADEMIAQMVSKKMIVERVRKA